ncbi:MAG: threonylcarbamoyl-AMP synthase [Alphaproteobacteria bacterium]|nr:threonylcarbamoyl-AMP synthase [Alphaproteobacteria bacterium]
MIKTANAQSINEAAKILQNGGLVAMPTETVYGLAANALDGAAVARIFATKSRPAFNPLIIHVPDLEAAQQIALFTPLALEAAHAFWPGPLSLILPRREDCRISDLASAGLPTLAVRIPAHPVALALLRASGLPLAAPSANESGKLSPTTPAHVADTLAGRVDMILAAGSCKVGLESTILDISGAEPVILRPGAITAPDIHAALGVKPCAFNPDGACTENAPKAPGMLLKHYAPDTNLRLRAIDLEPGEALLAFGSERFMGIKGGGAATHLPEHLRRNLSESGDLHEAARNLFAMLKVLDSARPRQIAVMPIPETGLGIAINDRLKRAAQRD